MTFDNLIALHEMLWPDTNLEQQLAKFKEEEKEYKETLCATEESLYELADMIIVSAGVARFDYMQGIGLLFETLYAAALPIDKISELWQAVEKKVEKLKKRVWVKDPQVGYKHTKGIED